MTKHLGRLELGKEAVAGQRGEAKDT